jgi:hypothetical protein
VALIVGLLFKKALCGFDYEKKLFSSDHLGFYLFRS